MGYQIYKVGKRWGGYGVPCVCEYPNCKKRIDRGVSYACGGEPFSEHGCDRYFCEKHLEYRYWEGEEGDWCKHEDDCECEMIPVCERCFQNKESFPYKPEVKSWVRHLLKHSSWKEWRDKNPDEVKKLLAPLAQSPTQL